MVRTLGPGNARIDDAYDEWEGYEKPGNAGEECGESTRVK